MLLGPDLPAHIGAYVVERLLSGGPSYALAAHTPLRGEPVWSANAPYRPRRATCATKPLEQHDRPATK